MVGLQETNIFLGLMHVYGCRYFVVKPNTHVLDTCVLGVLQSGRNLHKYT